MEIYNTLKKSVFNFIDVSSLRPFTPTKGQDSKRQ